MKASKEQQDNLRRLLMDELKRNNISLKDAQEKITMRDCWTLLCRGLNNISEERPSGFGTARDWLFTGLNDSHIETVFKKIFPVLK